MNHPVVGLKAILSHKSDEIQPKGIVSITNIYRVAHTPVKMQVLTAVSIPNGADARALFICCCFFVTSCLPQFFIFFCFIAISKLD